MLLSLRILCTLAILAYASGPCRAQCQWSPGGRFPSAAGDIYATLEMPNGDLIIGGEFASAGDVSAACMARWNGVSWSALGAGISSADGVGVVYALARLPNGEIVAGGHFDAAGGGPVFNIARWNGLNWSPLASGLNGDVAALLVLPNGDLVAGGFFTAAGTTPMQGLARWNGAAWTPLATGPNLVGIQVRALALMSNGDLAVGGNHNAQGGQYGFVARYQATGWTTLHSELLGRLPGPWHTPPPYAFASALLPLPNGELIVGGRFDAQWGGPPQNILRWTGSSWTSMGLGFDQTVEALVTHPIEGIIAFGNFTFSGGIPVNHVARWNGTDWQPIGSGPDSGPHCAAVLPNGHLITGGRFPNGNQGVWCDPVCRWDGATWSLLGPGTDGGIYALATMPNGDLVAGGAFRHIEGVHANRIARRVGATWRPLGTGFNSTIWALAATPSGDIVVGGSFTEAGGVKANRIARWNGESWSPLGQGVPGVSSVGVNAIQVMPNGDVVAAGRFSQAGTAAANNIARWNGVDWAPLAQGTSGSSPTVNALAVLHNGDLVAGGSFTSPASLIARWDGAQWWSLGTGLAGANSNQWVREMVVLPGGDLVVSGIFDWAGGAPVQNVARWNGSVWSSMGQIGPATFSLAVRPDGQPILQDGWMPGGYFLKRWDGSTWSPFGSPLDDWVFALTSSPAGEVSAGGRFHTAGGQVSAYLCHVSCPCYPNCDNSTLVPLITANDFQCFLNRYAAADPYANCDGSTLVPLITANDFQCFLNAFAAGCP